MPSSNPYRAPAEIESDSTGSYPTTRIGIEFETDWSAAGLKLRRKSSWHRVFDVAFGAFSLLWLLSLIDTFSPANTTAGLVCMLTPIWIAVSIAWVSHLSHRTGHVFQRRYPGLAGRVAGSIDGNIVVLRGPTIDLAAATKACTQCHVFPNQALIQPPGIETVLPIADRDIKRKWEVEHQRKKANVAERLLQRLVPSGDTIHVGGILKGSDLRGLPRYRQHILIASISIASAVILFGSAAYQWLQLPQWVTDPPAHYLPSDQDRVSLAIPVLLTCLAAVLLLYGLWRLVQLWKKIGRFEAVIAPDMIAIADRRAAYGYHGEALNHFRWTDAGLLSEDADGVIQFLLPRRWFDPSSQRFAAERFARSPQPIRKDVYLQPRI